MASVEQWEGIVVAAALVAGLSCAASFLGCGSSAEERNDAGPGADGGSQSTTVAAPRIPWLSDGTPPVALTPCPAGWHEVGPVGDTAPTECDPYPEGGMLDCPEGQAHFPGEAGCEPVGAQCPTSGDFAVGLPSDRRVIYVRTGSVGGDGTEAMPYGDFSEFGLGGLSNGTVIALSVGLHDGPVVLARDHELRGACAAQTRLRALEPHPFDGIVKFDGGGSLRDLGLSNSPRPGVFANTAEADARLEGVVVAATESGGLFAGHGARLFARTLLVEDIRARSDGMGGRGIDAESGATFDVARAVVQRARDNGIYVGEAAGAGVARDLVVRDTRAPPGGTGWGLVVDLGSSLSVERALLLANDDVGFAAHGPGTTATMSDVVVRETGSMNPDGTHGRGFQIQSGAIVDAGRVVSTRNREFGLFVAGTDATATLADVVVRDTYGRESDDQFGRGLNVQGGATARLERTWFSANRDIAMFASSSGSAIEALDVAVSNGMTEAVDGTVGFGAHLQRGASAELGRVLVSNGAEMGVVASGIGTAVALSDAVVRDTEGRSSDGLGGRGLNAQLGAVVDVRRAILSRNREIGLLARGGAIVTIEDTEITETRTRECADTTCTGTGAGHGVGSYEARTEVRMTRVSVRDSALCGLHVTEGASLDVQDGHVSGHPVGVCVQSEGYDTARLSAGVRFENNETNLQATSLPVPEAVEPEAVGDS